MCGSYGGSVQFVPHSEPSLSSIPTLSLQMLLPEFVEDEALPVMVQYIQQRHACLQTVVSDCNSHVDCAVVALLSAHCSIKEVALASIQSEAVPGTRMHLLAQFRSLTTCMLYMTGEYSEKYDDRSSHITSLLPFHHLPHLSLLDVTGGTVHDLNAARHLTTLALTSCEAVCSENCMCTSSLVQLHLCDCKVTNFHIQGVPACSRLGHLTCHDSCVLAGDPSRTLCLNVQHSDNNELQVPTSLTTLSTLTELNIGVRHIRHAFEMNWLTKLAALQSVSMVFNSTVRLTIRNLERLESLTGLTSLLLQNSSSKHNVTIGFDLGSCVALKSLVLSGSVTITHPLVYVASLKSLKEVIITGRDFEAAKLALAHTLGHDRPDVLFSAVS